MPHVSALLCNRLGSADYLLMTKKEQKQQHSVVRVCVCVYGCVLSAFMPQCFTLSRCLCVCENVNASIGFVAEVFFPFFFCFVVQLSFTFCSLYQEHMSFELNAFRVFFVRNYPGFFA